MPRTSGAEDGDFSRNSTRGEGIRPEKVKRGHEVVEIVKKTGRPHKLIPEKGLEKLIHDLGLATDIAAPLASSAVWYGDRRGRIVAPSKRQQEVAQLLVDGLTTAEAAEKLGISFNTISTHLERLRFNLGAHTREEALAMMQARELIHPARRWPDFSDRGKRARNLAQPVPKPKLVKIRPEKKSDEMSARGRMILRLLAMGYSNKEIAAELGISVETLKSHIGLLLKTTGARNRTHMAALAVTLHLKGGAEIFDEQD